MSNGRFIKAVSNGRFIKALAVLSKQKQPSGQTSKFEPRVPYYPAQVYHQERAQWLFCPGQVQWPFYRGLGSFIKAEAAKLPRHLNLSRGLHCKLHSIPRNQFICGRAKPEPAKAGPIAVLSRPCPMAVLSRQKQPSGQTSRFEPRIAGSILARAISLSPSGPSHQKRAQLPFYQGQFQWPFYEGLGRFTKTEAADCTHSQFISSRAKLFSAKAGPAAVLSRQGPMAVLSRPWPFYHGRSSQDATHAELSRDYPCQAIFSRSQPNGRFIKAGRPDGRFIKAWP